MSHGAVCNAQCVNLKACLMAQFGVLITSLAHVGLGAPGIAQLGDRMSGQTRVLALTLTLGLIPRIHRCTFALLVVNMLCLILKRMVILHGYAYS